MQKTVSIPDLTLNYQFGDQHLRIDPVAAIRKLDEIAEKHTRLNSKQYEHLAEFAEWLEQHTGVKVGDTVADWLWDSIRAEVLRQKKERVDGWLNFSPPTPE